MPTAFISMMTFMALTNYYSNAPKSICWRMRRTSRLAWNVNIRQLIPAAPT